jgi:hypothetical protein
MAVQKLASRLRMLVCQRGLAAHAGGRGQEAYPPGRGFFFGKPLLVTKGSFTAFRPIPSAHPPPSRPTEARFTVEY